MVFQNKNVLVLSISTIIMMVWISHEVDAFCCPWHATTVGIRYYCLLIICVQNFFDSRNNHDEKYHINYFKFSKDLKCQCDDGVNVHPWECCSTGGCNVFCCNCGAPCRTNSTPSNSIQDERRKRDVSDFDDNIYSGPTEEQRHLEAVNVRYLSWV